MIFRSTTVLPVQVTEYLQRNRTKAAELFLRHEGILLDSTYTGKAAAGLIGMISEGRFEKNDNVLFWHTGGLVNLF
jgi:1-aminocyclopropane-1-carboxylate deaminase/D-cysteine desulfhydrase-like pyridoxal-dependent ACC family enzyme